VVVASTKPLPSDVERPKSLGVQPWKPASIDSFREFDGRRFDRHVVRGDVRSPAPIDAASRALRAAPGVEAIRAPASPVEAQPDSRKPQNTHRPGGSP
jgi:hypothetical protein